MGEQDAHELFQILVGRLDEEHVAGIACGLADAMRDGVFVCVCVCVCVSW